MSFRFAKSPSMQYKCVSTVYLSLCLSVSLSLCLSVSLSLSLFSLSLFFSLSLPFGKSPSMQYKCDFLMSPSLSLSLSSPSFFLSFFLFLSFFPYLSFFLFFYVYIPFNTSLKQKWRLNFVCLCVIIIKSILFCMCFCL
jgi:hypothetical protein